MMLPWPSSTRRSPNESLRGVRCQTTSSPRPSTCGSTRSAPARCVARATPPAQGISHGRRCRRDGHRGGVRPTVATDATVLKQRLEAMARGVCEDDPRTLAQRRADALGALAAGSQHLYCTCDDPECPTATVDEAGEQRRCARHRRRGARARLPPIDGARRVRPNAGHDVSLPRLRPPGDVRRHRSHSCIIPVGPLTPETSSATAENTTG
jgi:hypothetical protein